MVASYTSRLRLVKPSTGDLTDTWGPIIDQMIDLLDDAISGVTVMTLTGGTYALSTSNNLPDEARRPLLRAQGVLAANQTVVVPNVVKTYYVTNETTGNFSLTMSAGGSGNTIQILQNRVTSFFCDGANNLYFLSAQVNYTNGAVDASEIGSVAGSAIQAGSIPESALNIAVQNLINGAATTGQLSAEASARSTTDTALQAAINAISTGLPATTVLGNATGSSGPIQDIPISSLIVTTTLKSGTVATPPGSPSSGDAYLVPANSSGAWSGQTGKIATWNSGGSTWIFTTPVVGQLYVLADTGQVISGSATTSTPLKTDALSIVIPFPANGSISLIQDLPFAVTITKISAQTTSGTCTLQLTDNGSLIGSTVGVSSTPVNSTVSLAVAVDHALGVTVSAASSPANLSLTIRFTYTN